MGKKVDKALDRLFVWDSQMLPAPLHEPFHGEVGKEIEINGGQGKGGVFTAPAFLPFNLIQGGPHNPAKLLRHLVERVGKVLVLELDDINKHEELVFSVIVDHGADGKSQQAEIVLGERIFERAQHSSAKTAHACAIVLNQAREQRLFVGEINVDQSRGNLSLLGNLPHPGGVESLPGEDLQGGSLNPELGLIDSRSANLGHEKQRFGLGR